MPRPRVLMLITLAEVGGAQTYVMGLLPALTAEFDVTVAAYGPGPLRAAAEAAGASYVELRHVRRPISPLRDLLGLIELIRLCRELRPTIVHANSSKAGILGRLAAAATGVPIRIFTVHGWAFAAYAGAARRVYLAADRSMRPLTTVAVCVAARERTLGIEARTARPATTVVIQNGVDTAAAPVADPVGDVPLIVTVGRIAYPKDFDTFADALAALAPGSFRGCIIGDGPGRPQLEARLAAHGLADRVELLGEVSTVAALLATADVFVLSSRSEGLPMSVLEAMAAGLPVVASAVGGIPELVTEQTGMLVPPAEPQALAGALALLIDDAGLRRSLGRAGRARATELFDIEIFRREHLALYRRELARVGAT